MNKKILQLCLLSGVTLLVLNGCTGAEVTPNNATQTGAVTGALVGSVIGYNSGTHSGRNAVAGGLIGAAVGGGLGAAVDSNNPPPQQTGGWQ